jgi:DNA-binding Xre family transcriptional regulator
MQLQDGPVSSAVDDRGMNALDLRERLALSEEELSTLLHTKSVILTVRNFLAHFQRSCQP